MPEGVLKPLESIFKSPEATLNRLAEIFKSSEERFKLPEEKFELLVETLTGQLTLNSRDFFILLKQLLN